jgi:hypothetical protein
LLKRILLLIIPGVISLLLYSCSDAPSQVGVGLLKGDGVNVQQLDSYTDSLNQKSSYSKRVIPLGAGGTILIGQKNNIKASALVEFYFATLDDTTLSDIKAQNSVVTSAQIILYHTYTYGDSNAALDFSVHKVNTDWTPTGFDADSLSILNYDATDLSSNRTFTDSITTMNFDNGTVTQWLIDQADSNNTDDKGVYFNPSSTSQKVEGYQALSVSSTVATELRIVLVKQGVYSDTLSFYPIADVSVVSGTLPSVPSEDIVVQSSLTANSKLWFDVSKIPQNALISGAQLTLTEDTVNSILGSIYDDYLTIYNLKDSTNTLLDSTTYVSIAGDGKSFQGSIIPIVQKWVKTGDNQGLFIQGYDLTSGLELFALKSTSATDRSVRPRLQITYTIKK